MAEQEVWYEQWPSEVGQMSLQALGAIAAKPPVGKDPRRWLQGDHQTLFEVLDFEQYLEDRGLPKDAPLDVRRALHGDLSAWHAALPFSESERRLILSAEQELHAPWRPGELGRPELASHIRMTVSEEMLDCGIRRETRGRDLMRRWWAWRRETDEFEGQGSLAEAKTALIQFAGRLVPPEGLPDVYYRVQGLVRPVGYRRD